MDLIGFLIDVIVFCIIGGLVYYIVSLMPLPEPFKTILVCAVLLILLLVLVGTLMGGGPPIFYHRIR